MSNEPIVLNIYPGGFCGPKGSVSYEAFHRRRKIVLTAMVQEDSVRLYAESLDACLEFGAVLAEVLYDFLRAEREEAA